MLDYTPESICDAPLDRYDIGADLFADRCVCGAERADEAFCVPCRNAIERAIMAPLVISLAAHVRAVLAGAPCLSCGDMTICGSFCAACREMGEPQRLAVAPIVTLERAA